MEMDKKHSQIYRAVMNESTALLSKQENTAAIITAEVVDTIPPRRTTTENDQLARKNNYSDTLIPYPDKNGCFEWLLALALSASK